MQENTDQKKTQHLEVLLDTGTCSLYAFKTLIEIIKKRPVKTKVRNIEMMMHRTTKKIDESR